MVCGHCAALAKQVPKMSEVSCFYIVETVKSHYTTTVPLPFTSKCECCWKRTAIVKTTYKRGRGRRTFNFCIQCRNNHKFSPNEPMFGNPDDKLLGKDPDRKVHILIACLHKLCNMCMLVCDICYYNTAW